MNVPEYLGDGAWETARRLLSIVFRLLIDTGGQSIGIRFGTGTVTWPGGARLSSTTTVTHGLATTPVAVLLTSSSSNVALSSTAVGATTFGVIGNTMDGSSPAAATARDFYYLVIG